MSSFDEQEAIAAFIENEMDLYMAKTSSEKMDLIDSLVDMGNIDVNTIIEYFESEILHSFSWDYKR